MPRGCSITRDSYWKAHVIKPYQININTEVIVKDLKSN